MYLVSHYGERHEDRIPEGIFTSLDKIREWLDVKDSFVNEVVMTTDYNDSAIEFTVFYSSKEDFEKLSQEEQNQIDYEVYVAEQFELDGDESEQSENKIIEILPIENFKDLNVRNDFKASILEVIEHVQLIEIRGIHPFSIREWFKEGTEVQIRELLHELEKDGKIISTGSIRDKKYSISQLAEKARAEYEKECNMRKLKNA